MIFEEFLKEISTDPVTHKTVYLTGEQNLSLTSILSVALSYPRVEFKLSEKRKLLIEKIIKEKNRQIRIGIPMYGTTTGYGGRAGIVLNHGDEQEKLKNATRLSASIVHVDVSTGPSIQKEIVRAAMLIRVNMLLTGVSAVRLQVLYNICKLLNLGLTPVIGQYGSVGASGDLAQNGRVVSVLMQNHSAKVIDKKGRIYNADIVLNKQNIRPVKLEPKEGLALVNGDNFSSASCLYVSYRVTTLFLLNHYVNALVIQALHGSDRNYHPFLSKVRPHKGQEFSAKILRYLLNGSKLARQEMKGHMERKEGELVQDPYSIRCLPQYYGPDWEELISIWETLKINVNSVSDNPLWIPPEHTLRNESPYQWISGGNFMAMHMAESLDKLRKIMVHIIKINDRHLSRLVHPAFNNGLPANLSDSSSVGQSTFKGLQTQMGMYEVYSSLLILPASTAFGIHEEFNQDITSHAPSSSILSWELLKITEYAIATNLIAACQAIDLRGGEDMLSDSTKQIYSWVRKIVPYIKKEQPLGYCVEEVADQIKLFNFQNLVRGII